MPQRRQRAGYGDRNASAEPGRRHAGGRGGTHVGPAAMIARNAGWVLIGLACFGCSAKPPATTAAVMPAAAPAVESPSTFAPAAPQDVAAAAEMAGLYRDICLTAFPDLAAMTRALNAHAATPLTAKEVAAYLHADPGQGWQLHSDIARYVVTVEAPPFHTCGVRRMTRSGFPTAKPYVAALRAFAATRSLALGATLPLPRTGADGSNTLIYGTPLLAPGGQGQSETSMYITTNYHGRLNPKVWPETVGGVGVEVRMAHTLAGAAR